MTRKETLLARKYELQNELRILRGEEPYNLAERTSDWRFHMTAKEEREYTLKAGIERLTAAYYATAEGAAAYLEDFEVFFTSSW